MPNRNPMALALRTPRYRTKRTPSMAEKLRKLGRKRRGRLEAGAVINGQTN